MFGIISKIPKTVSVRKLTNFSKLREHINKTQIHKVKDDEDILEWVDEVYRQNDGEKLPQQLMKKSKHGGKPQLTSEAAAGFRNIIYTIPDLGLSKVPYLFSLVGEMIRGRPFEEDELPSVATIRSHLARLDAIDRYEISQIFKTMLDKLSPCGN